MDNEKHFLVEAMKEYFGELSLKERNLIATSVNKMNENIDNAVDEFGISSYETYRWIEDGCFMEFSDNDIPKVVAKADYVGSIVCGEWKWSWTDDEKEINTQCKENMLSFKEYAQEFDFDYLKVDTFPADERIGWVMSAIAALFMQSRLIYKIERCEATEFYLFSHIVKVAEEKKIDKYFEYQKEKFWNISIDEKHCVHIHHGIINSIGKKTVMCYASKDKAEKLAQRFIANKLSKGYLEIMKEDRLLSSSTSKGEKMNIDTIEILKKYKKSFRGYEIPETLVKLAEFDANLENESYGESFWLRAEENIFKYLLDNSLTSKEQIEVYANHAIVFANADGTGGFYAFWVEDNKSDLEEAPIVAYGSEGEVKIVAKNLKELIKILSYGAEGLNGNYGLDCYDSYDEFLEYNPNFLAFRTWMKKELDIEPIKNWKVPQSDDVNAIIEDANKVYKKRFNAWQYQFYKSPEEWAEEEEKWKARK